ncbi:MULTISPECIES: sugar ABC transporter substrate-binding protein [Enterocloster]|uniref:Monosaccharide ABC transporter substrate-binding protein, CUT2 family (TC 3.A.1.2.-) n=1 Tax=Enterocloster lavalensis TaxID=460384 RepID=A0A1I0K3F4_9FIRM|nr:MULTISPECIES: substrate-binding domain-containing protein [Enterocloster]MBS5606615.1 substrate-binding domain-containing protein [Enterocloster asparagiformis]MCB6344430.1 substrate-binding domain-containing protein [Enterocloster lavalensis]MDR3759386.1 substrate-binding domain-containing protein [Enterocloster sp.]PST29823.1 sugar ABC transporter substrate-binding protein [Enterocloster lavalensis]SEU17604.1 monosaccharide ABC transporter substrate-binding protein, CUT2 family (TC 3.A.1.
MKKVLSVVLASAMVLSLAACGGQQTAATTAAATEAATEAAATAGTDAATEAAKEETTAAEATADLKGKMMGVVTPAADHGFTAESIQHCEAEVKALAEKYGFDYKFMTAAESGEQSNAVETILALQPDVMILWPVTGDELRSAAQSVQDAGVPLIIYDRLIEGFEPTSWIMGDNDAIGEGAGKYFSEYFKEDLAAGEVGILEFKGDSSTVPMQRSNGFWNTADKNFKLIQDFSTDWSQQIAMEQMESFLNTKSVEEIESIKAIFTHDDEIVFGIVEALKNYNGPANINIKLISGVSGGEGFMDLFENSGLEGIDFMTYTFSPSMVRDAVGLGLKVLQGETLDSSYLIPTEMIDKTDYKEYMESDLYKIRYSL